MSLMIGGAMAAGSWGDEPLWVYIGSYTSEGGSEGIYRAEFDAESGKIGVAELAAEMVSPSFLEISPTKKTLYAVSEAGSRQGVWAYSIDPESGALSLLNVKSTGGDAPCHVAVDPTGRTVVAANYTGGSVRSFPAVEDGRLGGPGSFFQHEGSSVNPARQRGPHGHSVNFSPDGRFVFAADLGLDEIKVYRADHGSGEMVGHDPGSVKVAPGAGPRHFVFHPSGRFAYVINEMHMTVTAFSYDAERGRLEEIETVSTVPGGKAVKGGSTAEIRVHPSGKFLYGSNRGHDTIAVYQIDAESGRLSLVENEGEGIRTPRNFNLDPSGRWCLVANQSGGSVAVFSVDQETGELAATGHSTKVD
ncbi:MAG: lactonase family protein, partial [Verrucomicrobiales bacterium]|nr:lactonase family protein [Verrucomicrobiales bacterium]